MMWCQNHVLFVNIYRIRHDKIYKGKPSLLKRVFIIQTIITGIKCLLSSLKVLILNRYLNLMSCTGLYKKVQLVRLFLVAY